MTTKFTCINCRVAFSDSDIQRQHYKTDWHRYNLKRKVVELPPVSAEEFQRRVLQQREQDDESEKNQSVFCNICHKTFNSPKSFENHLKSKKHLSLINSLQNEPETVVSPVIAKSQNISSSNSKLSTSEDDSDVEEVDSDEWDDEFSDDNPALRNDCLFCKHHSATMTKSLKHMTLAHSFFIPDIEYLINLKGLLCYLGEKIVQGYICLWCNERGKSFYSTDAVQQHMIDKGHCKMLHEGEALLEYSDFYDYSRSYPDHEIIQESVEDDEISIPIIEDENYQLTLPSGAIIGHRSLLRYYRQNIDPKRVIVPVQKKVHRVIAEYRALGWKESEKQAIAKKARDLKFMQKIQSKLSMKLGVKANNLSIKRPQVNF